MDEHFQNALLYTKNSENLTVLLLLFRGYYAMVLQVRASWDELKEVRHTCFKAFGGLLESYVIKKQKSHQPKL